MSSLFDGTNAGIANVEGQPVFSSAISSGSITWPDGSAIT